MKNARTPKDTSAYKTKASISDTDHAREALHAIPPDIDHDNWVRAGMAAKDAGLDFQDFDSWSQGGQSYREADARSAWRSFKTNGGIGAGTLFEMAKQHGWKSGTWSPVQRTAPPKPQPQPKRECPHVAAVWGRCQPAASHPYIEAKDGILDGLRVVPEGDSLTIAGHKVVGWLVVPAYADSTLQSLQFIPPPGHAKKLNMPGAPMAGTSFAVGKLSPDAMAYVVEGIGQAWACHKATGRPAVVAFGWGNVRRVAAGLNGPPVLVPDRGKEKDAAKIAVELGATVAYMPEQAPDNYDANDYAQREGYEALAKLLGQAVKQTLAYPKPEPLPDTLPDVEAFESELLPSTLADRCADIAARMQCAPDFPAIGGMVALGSVIGRTVGVHPKRFDDWLVVPNLWGCIVGRPSVLKSPALKDALNPLGQLEADANKTYEQAKQEHDTAKALADLEKDNTKKQARKAVKDGNTEQAKHLLAESQQESEPPTLRRYKTNDATVEKLGELLSENPRGILMFRDELAGWLAGLEKEGREGERSFYLEAFNGTGSFVYDRIGRGTINIDACTVSVLGGTQPGKLAQYVRHAIKGGTGDDGLMQRFQMLVWPDNGGWAHIDRWPDKQAKQQAKDIFKHLAEVTPEDVGATTGDYDELPALRFNANGQAVFDEWYTALMQRIRGDDMPAYLEAHLAKYASLMPSLALIIHLAEYGTGPVPEEAATRAAAWCEYLESHARRMYAPGLMGDELAAAALAKKLKAGKIGLQFTARELYRKGWASLNTPDDATAAIDALTDYGWLLADDAKPSTGGRPHITYSINPLISEVAL